MAAFRTAPLDAGARDGGSDAGIDGGFDAGVDAGFDAGIDGGADAGLDGGTDAGVDAGTDGGVDLETIHRDVGCGCHTSAAPLLALLLALPRRRRATCA